MNHELRFPLALALLTLLATSAALLLAVFGVHWGALARGDALDLSATYVLQALLAVIFLIWPAMRVSRAVPLSQFLMDALTMLVSATPAAIFGWWLSEYAWSVDGGAVLMPLAFLAVAGSLLALVWRAGNNARQLVQALLLLWYCGGAIVLYLQAEFLPAAAGAWRWYVPAFPATRHASWQQAMIPLVAFGAAAVVLLMASFFLSRHLKPAKEGSTQLV